MKTLTQYREDIKALMKKVGDIDAKCTHENRDPTDAEGALKSEILDEVDSLRRTVGTLERQERISAELERPVSEPLTRPGPTVRTPQEQPARDRFATLGEQLAAVYRAGLTGKAPGGHVDPRLFTAAATGLNETVPSEGGFLVQQDFTNALLEDTFETGVLASRVGTRIPISGNANSTVINGVDETSRVSTRWGGIVSYWVGEGQQGTAKKPAFRRIELNLKKLMGLCYATDENLSDASQLESIIRRGFVSEFGFQLDDCLYNGTGAGQPLGIMNAGSLVSVSKETGQGAATITTENIVKMYARRFAPQTGNYVWYYNQSIEPQLFTMSLSVGTGGFPVYMPPGGLSDAPYGRILGLPAIAIEQAAALGTVGDIVLGNFKDGYVLAEKGGIQSAMSIHVRFDYDESVFRFILRVDGQPVRASALTPYKGGNTLGHFIALATRA